MSEEKLSQFCSIIFYDISLQEKLREMIDREEFVRAVVEMGSERGFDFTADEIENALRAGRRVWIERWIR